MEAKKKVRKPPAAPRAKKRAPATAQAVKVRPDKKPFDIEAAIPLLREAVAPYPKAALFELAGDGHTSVFEILVACVISIRTHDATVSTQPFQADRTSRAGPLRAVKVYFAYTSEDQYRRLKKAGRHMDEQISVRQAYLAMYSFLEELYSKYEYDQFGALLGGMGSLPDGSPADPAIWLDWLEAVERARKGQVDTALNIRRTGEEQSG